MSRRETVLKVFVASPSNVLDERNRLSEVVDEVNSVMAKHTGVRLDLLRYEQEASPDFGEDAQAVINRQIPQDYEIFIGIVWYTIGSSTKRAASGTIEEYELAKTRFDKDAKSVRLMLYFKDAPPSSLSDIEPQQFMQVQAFRSRVADEGALYATFTTTDDFANKIRKHLMKHVQEWDAEPKGATDISFGSMAATDQPIEQCEDEEPDDEGIIDLEEIIEDEMASLADVLERMNVSITDIGDSTNTRTSAVNALASPDGKELKEKERQKTRTELKRITKATSGDMKRFVRKMGEDVPLFKQHLDRALRTLAKAVPIYKEFNDDRTELNDNVTKLLISHRSMLGSMELFHESVVGLPKLSTALVRSKREMEKSLQQIINITRAGITSLEEIVTLLAEDS